MGATHSSENQPFFDYGSPFSISLKQTILMPGETVQGSVIINANQQMPIFSVLVGVYRESRTYWSETHGMGDRRRTVRYRGHEVIANEAYPVFSTGG